MKHFCLAPRTLVPACSARASPVYHWWPVSLGVARARAASALRGACRGWAARAQTGPKSTGRRRAGPALGMTSATSCYPLDTLTRYIILTYILSYHGRLQEENIDVTPFNKTILILTNLHKTLVPSFSFFLSTVFLACSFVHLYSPSDACDVECNELLFRCSVEAWGGGAPPSVSAPVVNTESDELCNKHKLN